MELRWDRDLGSKELMHIKELLALGTDPCDIPPITRVELYYQEDLIKMYDYDGSDFSEFLQCQQEQALEYAKRDAYVSGNTALYEKYAARQEAALAKEDEDDNPGDLVAVGGFRDEDGTQIEYPNNPFPADNFGADWLLMQVCQTWAKLYETHDPAWDALTADTIEAEYKKLYQKSQDYCYGGENPYGNELPDNTTDTTDKLMK